MIVRGICRILCMACLLLTAAAWAISGPMVGNWAVERASGEPLARFEARESAVAALWLVRCAAPLGALLACFAARRSARLERLLVAAWQGLVRATRIGSAESSTPVSRSSSAATWLVRGALAAWLGLGIVHVAGSIVQRLREWPHYHWSSGEVVLPNMSDANREVIRYVQAVTPEDARILVVSDQALFFLSYSLLPRRILHRVHPETERVIPQPDQQRQLAAYRLEDFSAADLAAFRPDYVLEYFEGPAYVDRARLLDDAKWIAFVRASVQQPGFVPPYEVRLREYPGGAARP